VAPDSDSPSRSLADFLAGLSGRVEDRLLRRAADALVDTVGCIIQGAGQPWSRAAIAHALATGGDGAATVIGAANANGSPTTPAMAANANGSPTTPAMAAFANGSPTTPAMAAFANGSSAHAFELDDVCEEAISHPGAVVVPAAMALAEDRGATNLDLLEAILIGYEAMGRAGLAVGPAAHMLAGFHPTSASGVFGSAAAAGRLLGFDGQAMNHAFGIAVSLASGTMEFASSGGMAKRIHAGRAAEAGLLAASLVARGVEGAGDGLAGRYGFCRVFGAEPQLDRLTDGLGSRWVIDEITVKPYAACSDIHPLIQAAAELQAEHGFDPARIIRIEADCPTKAATQNSMDGTASVMAAQYSAPFNIAAALLADPRDPATYGPKSIADPALAELQAKVAPLRPAPEFDRTYAWKLGGRVRVVTASGEVFEWTVCGQKGSMHDPLSRSELDAKFERLVGGLAPAGTADAIRQALSAHHQPAAWLLRGTGC